MKLKVVFSNSFLYPISIMCIALAMLTKVSVVNATTVVIESTSETYVAIETMTLPDITKDGFTDFGILYLDNNNNKLRLQIIDGVSLELGSVIIWNNHYDEPSLHVLPDINGNNVPEIGVFGVRNDGNNSGKPQFFAKDLSTGQNARVFNWPANWQSVKVLILQDMTEDGMPEIAIQGRFKEGNRPQLVVKNGATGAAVTTYSYPDLFISPEFFQHSDVDGDGVAEISTFGRVKRNNKIQVKIASGVNPRDRLKAYNFPDKWSDISWHRLDDMNGDGEDEWGLFGRNREDNRFQLIVKEGTNPKGALAIYAWSADLQDAKFFRVPDMNSDGIDEVAVGGRRSNGRYQFQVKDGANRNTVLANHNLNLPLEQISFHILPDLTGDGKVEIGFLGTNISGETELVIQEGDVQYGEYTRYSLGSDWLEAPLFASNGDTDEDGFPNLIAYEQQSTAEDIAFVSLRRANLKPIVNAGPDQTVEEKTTVTLSGSGLDRDGSITTFSWTQTSGTIVELSETNTADLSFFAPDIDSRETLKFELSVTDNEGDTSRSSVLVNVIRTNLLPSISSISAPEYAIEGEVVNLSVTASDTDGTISALNWELVDSNSVVKIENADSAKPNFIAPELTNIEELTFEVTVTDELGGISKGSISIPIIPVLSDVTASSKPIIVSLSSDEANSIGVDWLPAEDNFTPASLMNYEIHMSDTGSFIPSTNTLISSGNRYSDVIDSLSPGETYYIKIIAKDLNANQSWSREKSITLSTIETQVISDSFVSIDQLASRNVDIANATISLDSTEAGDIIESGDIVVNSDNGGYLAKIEEVKEENGVTTLTMSDAALNEVFENVSLNLTVDMADLEQQNALVSTGLARAKGSVGIKGNSYIYTWQKSGLTLVDELPNNNAINILAKSKKTVHRSAGKSANITKKNKSVQISSPVAVVVEPGKSADFRVIAEVAGGYDDFELYSLKMLSFSHPSIEDTNGDDYGVTAVSETVDTNNQTLSFEWSPTEAHIDHEKSKPFVAVYEAFASKDGCTPSIFKCNEHKILIETEVYVSFGDIQDQATTSGLSTTTQTDLSVNAQATIDFLPEITVFAEIQSRKLQRAQMSIAGGVNFNVFLELIATAAAEAHGEKELIKKKFVKVFTAGPVPVVITGEFTLTGYLDAEAYAELDLVNELNLNFDLEAGLSYTKEDGWQPIQKATPELIFTISGNAEGNAEATIKLIPQLTLKAYQSIASTINVEPYLFAEAELQGKFDYIYQQSPESLISDSDAQYRFKQLDAGAGLNVNFRAGLEIFEKGIVGYPSADIDELATIEVFEKTVIWGLPNIEIEKSDIDVSYPDSTASVFAVQTTDVPNPFKSDGSSLNPFVDESSTWEVFPETGDFSFKQVTQGENKLIAFSYTVPTKYTIRYVGNSQAGSFLRQYEELEFDANDYNENGMPDVWEDQWGISDPNADPDGDELSNLEEFQNKTLPDNKDSDGDGISDGIEVANGTNPIDFTGDLPDDETDPTDGLIAYYPFDGDANDASGNGNNGEVSGSIEFDSEAISGQSVKFSDSGFVSSSNVFSADTKYSDPFTISAWIKTNSTKHTQAIVNQWTACTGIPSEDFFHFTLYKNQGLQAEITNNAGEISIDGSNLNDGEWHHVAFSSANQKLDLYVDGENMESVSYNLNSQNIPYDTKFNIGGFVEGNCTNTTGFVGNIDEVRIYNRALNQSDIQALSIPLENGLIAYYPFDGNAHDSIGQVDGEEVGTISYSPDSVSGQAAEFDGNSQININPNWGIIEDFTVNFYVKSISNKDAMGLVTKHHACGVDSDYWFSVLYGTNSSARAGKLTTAAYENGRVSAARSEIADGNWHSITLAVGSRAYDVYVDGSLIGTRTYSSGSWEKNTAEITIGGFFTSSCPINHNFVGLIDEVSFYDSKLDSNQISQILN